MFLNAPAWAFLLLVQSAAVPPQIETPPLSLAEASERALEQASAYQLAVDEESIIALDVTQAHAALFPKIRNLSTLTYNEPLTPHSTDPAFIGANAVREYESLIGAEGIWDFGLRAAVRRNRELLAAAHAGTEIARRDLLRGLREAYFGLALARAKRRSAEETLAAAREFERITTLQQEGGEVAEVDAIRARLQTAQRLDEVEQARAEEVIAAAGLRVLIGVAPENDVAVNDLTPAPSMAEIERMSAVPIMQRPQLVQAAAQERAAREDAGVARAERLPSLAYAADEGFDSASLQSEDVRLHSGYLLSASLRIPILDWGAARARQRQAEIRAESSARQLALARRDIEQKDLRARQVATSAIRRADNARSAVADAQRNVDISIDRYRAGEASIVEVTDALTTLAQQRVNLQQALFDFEVARGELQEGAQ